MTPWYNIGRRTASRSVLWFKVTHGLFTTKFLYSYSFPSDITRHTLMPLIKRILMPSCRKMACVVQTRCIHEGSESDSDSELEVSGEVTDTYNETELFSVRHLLYPSSVDPLIKQLNSSVSIQNVFDFIREQEHVIDEKLVSQAVLVLWDLQKIFYNVNIMEYQNPVISSLLNPSDILNKYISEVNKHPDFEHLLQLVDKWYQEMSPDAATATLLYLNKMGVNLDNPVMQKLILHCESMLKYSGQRFPLTALSRFTVAVHSKKGLWPIFILKNSLPLILTGIESCDNVEDFRLLTACLVNISRLVSSSVLSIYKCKVEDLLNRKVITEKDSGVITKVIKFLNYPHWSYHNYATVCKLLNILKGNVRGMAPRDVVTLHKVFQNQLEPADMMEEMNNEVTQLLSQVEDEKIASSPLAFQVTTDLLSCLVTFASPKQKVALEKLALRHVEGSSSSTIPILFKIIRHLKTSNIQLCDAFWSKTLQHMKDMPEERQDYKLFRVSHRYMYFNNNLGGTYRHYDLERQMIQWLWNEVKNGTASVIPTKFARVASFILAYGNICRGRSVISNPTLTEMVSKLVEMAPQFNKLDCLYISRGLQIGTNLGYQRKNMTPHFLEVYTVIDTAMNNCAMQFLKEEVLNLPEINRMMKAYIGRRGTYETQLFEHLIQRYENVTGIMSSRDLRDVANNLLIVNCLVPSIIDKMVNYVIENGNHIIGETVVKLLYLCYSVSYTPLQAEQFFLVSSAIILRDKERMPGLLLLQAGITLCFFHQLPEDLIHFIFTVDFLERLDEEVLNCYAKATYPARVRYTMMQLNRAVCLDYPESDVPWFHKKYCQQIVSLESPKITHFHKDVRQSLIAILGEEYLVQTNQYTPYFYRIDFQVLLNKDKKPVSAKHQNDLNITRIAFLLWKKEDYTCGVLQLCGEQQLKQRHLEMLGYKVIGINSSVWNSMYMTEPKAKTDYLRSQLWPTATDSEVKCYN